MSPREDVVVLAAPRDRDLVLVREAVRVLRPVVPREERLGRVVRARDQDRSRSVAWAFWPRLPARPLETVPRGMEYWVVERLAVWPIRGARVVLRVLTRLLRPLDEMREPVLPDRVRAPLERPWLETRADRAVPRLALENRLELESRPDRALVLDRALPPDRENPLLREAPPDRENPPPRELEPRENPPLREPPDEWPPPPREEPPRARATSGVTRKRATITATRRRVNFISASPGILATANPGPADLLPGGR